MQKYEKAYHKLFTAVSRTIELMEVLIFNNIECSDNGLPLLAASIRIQYLSLDEFQIIIKKFFRRDFFVKKDLKFVFECGIIGVSDSDICIDRSMSGQHPEYRCAGPVQ